jgi:hypothetical protein
LSVAGYLLQVGSLVPLTGIEPVRESPPEGF